LGISLTSSASFLNNAALSWTHGYDALDRLNSASTSSQSQTFTYDANGNRLTQGGSSTSTYTVDTVSNRLSSIAGALVRTYGYDAAGHTSGFGGLSFTYNAAGRLSSASTGGVTTSAVYNALGQLRISRMPAADFAPRRAGVSYMPVQWVTRGDGLAIPVSSAEH
jgi:YD repeat-containing protein